MFLKIDHDAAMHQKVCEQLSKPFDGFTWFTSKCDCKKRGIINKGTKICLLRTEKGIAFITTEDGQLGCLRVS